MERQRLSLNPWRGPDRRALHPLRELRLSFGASIVIHSSRSPPRSSGRVPTLLCRNPGKHWRQSSFRCAQQLKLAIRSSRHIGRPGGSPGLQMQSCSHPAHLHVASCVRIVSMETKVGFGQQMTPDPPARLALLRGTDHDSGPIPVHASAAPCIRYIDPGGHESFFDMTGATWSSPDARGQMNCGCSHPSETQASSRA